MKRNISSILDLMDRMGITPRELSVYFAKNRMINLDEIAEIVSSLAKKKDEESAPVFEKLKSLISAKCDCNEDDITEDCKFGEDLGFDSLDSVELIVEAERAFDIALTDEEAERVQTVNDLLLLIKKKLSRKGNQ